MNRLLVILLLLSLFSCCEEIESSFDESSIEDSKGTILGTIVDNFGGELGQVSVKVYENSSLESETNTSSGNTFEFSNLTVGSYTIEASKDGFYTYSENITVYENQTTNVSLKLSPESLPSGGILKTSVLNYTSTSATFEIDFFVADQDANFLTNLASGDISISSSQTSDGEYFDFSLVELKKYATTTNGAYSANLLIDQSGSISNTDPNDARLQAAKIFCSSLGSSDYVIVSAFSSGTELPYNPVTYWGEFHNNGTSFYSVIDNLKSMVGGGTPLFESTVSMISLTANDAPTSNKAVILFTDGEDTEGGKSITDVVNTAKNKNVKIFTVGLGEGTNLEVLAKMAGETGGAFMLAYDARKLISIYGTLGNLLHGGSTMYRGKWKLTTSAKSFPGWFQTSIKVLTESGIMYIPIHVKVG